MEQVRDNPTNCGEVHYYGGVNYSSTNFRGLNGLMTGIRHWQKTSGRALLLGEFGNQPWTITAISVSSGVATITCAASCPLEVGDTFRIAGTSIAFDTSYTVATINAERTSITATTTATGSWFGSVVGLQTMSDARLTRMCRDIIDSNTDVALFWSIDNDPLYPIWQSISEDRNASQRAIILAANTELGW